MEIEVFEPSEGGGGVTDHGALSGLADDDHPQYLTEARGDARYWPLATDLATQAELDAHVNDTTDAHDASAVSVADVGGYFTATDVEGALQELGAGGGGVTDHGALTGLADDDHPQYHNDIRGDARYWRLTTDLATQAELNAHLNDTVDAHDASAISIVDGGGSLGWYLSTDVEGALGEIGERVDTHRADFMAHLNDTVNAHGASAVSILDSGGYFTGEDVESALQELGAGGGGGGSVDPSNENLIVHMEVFA